MNIHPHAREIKPETGKKRGIGRPGAARFAPVRWLCFPVPVRVSRYAGLFSGEAVLY